MVSPDEMAEIDDTESTPSMENFEDGAAGTFLDAEGNLKSKYQKENQLIHLLPYAGELEEETEALLDKTLLNLSKAVLARDFLNGFALYTRSLGTFIDMYGRKFSKEQHIKLVELFLEVITMETVPLSIVVDVSELLQVLLKKMTLLTREDIVIPWRPLYETLDRWVYNRKYSLSCTANAKLEASLKSTIKMSSLYFPSASCSEIIAEFSPMLCPSSVKMNFGLEMLRFFLPFQNEECEAELREFIQFLLSFHDNWNNHPLWEWPMMNLLSAAAWSMPGRFDWNPYLPTVYARLMRNLDLPVYFKSAKSTPTLTSVKNYECARTARWIVSTLGNNPQALSYLKSFMKSLETYYNPANAGRWTMTLSSLLRDLADDFVLRVKRERYFEKKWWWPRTPEDRRLTEEDIDAFVEICSSPVLDFYLDLMYGGYVLKNFVILRPKVIIPAVMEKYYGMVETLTESKKFMTTMRWVMGVINMMVSSRLETDGFDGRQLVIPFANTLLPAIDPNDMNKTLTALSCLCMIFTHTNLVDCSALADNIDEADEAKREICHGTGGFDDFVIQLLDRIFTLIENRAHENTRMADSRIATSANIEDISLQRVIWAVCRPLATHSSTALCKVAVDKIVAFALGNLLETEVSGRLFASLCQSYAVSRPDIFLPKILPRLCASIEHHVTDDILDEEDPDKTLLFHILLLSYMVETIGPELLKFRSEIQRMLKALLRLNGKKAYGLAGIIIMRLLNSLLFVYPLENKLSDADFDDPGYMAFEDWGKLTHWKDTKVNWHTPSVEEIGWAKEIFLQIFTEFSRPIERMAGLTEADEALNKRLLKNLQILQSTYDGMCIVLPFWNDTPIVARDTIVDFSADPYTFGLPDFSITIPGTGENIKRKYFQLLLGVQSYLERLKPDDTDAFVAVIRGLDSLIVPTIEAGSRYITISPKLKKVGISVPEDISSLDPKKRFTRYKSIVRAYSLHLKRVRAAACSTWTESHVEVLEKLFNLCVNRYAKVRSIAQQRFCRYLDWSSGFLCRYITSYILEKLKPGVPHHEYKGALYVIQAAKCSPILINSWEELSRIWEALLRSPFSEKNSIILCMQNIQRIIARDFIFFPFQDRIPEGSRACDLAVKLLKESQQKSVVNLEPLDSSKNVEHFNRLVDVLLEHGPNTHWRKQLLGADMLSVLVVDLPIRRDVVEFFFNSLISQYIDIRRIALAAVPWIMSLFKRNYKTWTVNSRAGIKLAPGESIRSILQYKSQPSDRKYDLEVEEMVEDTEGPPVLDLDVHKTHEGFTALSPRHRLKVCPEDFSDVQDQPEGRKTAILTTAKYLSDPDYMQKLLDLWSVDDKTKGLGSKMTSFAKLVARNNGPESLRLLLELLAPLSKDKDQWKQRCVANVISGMLFGMKLWSPEKIKDFWTVLKPILDDCLNNVTQETYEYWLTAVSLPLSNRDGNKMRFFVQYLQERFVNSLESAQTTSVEAHNNLSFFEAAAASLQWRGGDLFLEILNEISKFFLDTPIPYRNVRVQLGRLLGDVFEWNIESALEFGVDIYSPCTEFLTNVAIALKNVVPESTKFQANDKESEENAEARKLLLKLKTVLEWINSLLWDGETTIHSKFYSFIPMLCYFESYDPDPEIALLASVALSGLSKHLIRPEHMEDLFSNLEEAASSPSWKARLCVLEFLKVFAIGNASIIVSSEAWATRTTNLVLSLLSERKLEVRELASRILCGFLHCLLVPNPMELLSKFKREADGCMKRRKLAHSKGTTTFGPEEVDRAHSAILGICAFVDTNPYTVPDYLPDILVFLTTHLNDCQPIPATIRKCLSNFRRTHHDNWEHHKQKFNEDQLCILTDIFVSPCYYA